jgi:hypothetical protein
MSRDSHGVKHLCIVLQPLQLPHQHRDAIFGHFQTDLSNIEERMACEKCHTKVMLTTGNLRHRHILRIQGLATPLLSSKQENLRNRLKGSGSNRNRNRNRPVTVLLLLNHRFQRQ